MAGRQERQAGEPKAIIGYVRVLEKRSRIRVPLTKARTLIRQQEKEAMQTLHEHPHFALF